MDYRKICLTENSPHIQLVLPRLSGDVKQTQFQTPVRLWKWFIPSIKMVNFLLVSHEVPVHPM